MSNTITNEQAEKTLLAFFWIDEGENDNYEDFRSYYSGIVSLVAHKHFGWTEAITERGYEQIVEAYNDLAKTDFIDNLTDQELDSIVDTFALSRNKAK